MAEDSANPGGENGAEALEPIQSSPKNMVVIVSVAISVLAVQTVAAYFTVQKLFFASPVEEQVEYIGVDSDSAKTAGYESEFENTGLIFEFEDIVVNPAGTMGRRFLAITMSFEVSEKKVLNELTEKEPVVRDALISLLTGRDLEYLSDVENMRNLRYDIMQNVNLYLEKGRVIRVYFTGYVLQ